MRKPSDAELSTLLKEAIAGNKGSYHQFLTSITPVLRGIINARASGLSAEVREDILQEALLAIHNKKHTWQPDKPLKPWLYAITRYKVTDELRRLGKASFTDIDDYDDLLPAEETDTTIAMDVETMINQLDGKLLDVVRKIGVEGNSISETATLLEMSENSVRVTFHRGLKRLSELRKKYVE